MSHYSVLVCLPADTELKNLDDALSAVLDRYDENREVERYRDYEEGSPDEHWFVSSVRSGAASHARLAEIGPEALAIERIEKHANRLPRNTSRAADMVREEAPKWREDAEWSARLGPGPLTWAQVAECHNARYHPGNELAAGGEDDSDQRLHIDDDGRAFTWSTRNPEAKWDYWRIGGRWGDYFIAAENGPGLINGERGWDSPKDDGAILTRLRVDGGPKWLLDFDAMRDEKAERDLVCYDRWQQIVSQFGEPPAWRDLVSLVDVKELSIEEARSQYNTHPAVKAARDAEIAGWGEGPEERFGMPREEFERLSRLGAVPGYAMVRLDGEWMAPGRMGWFGMSSDEAGEREAYWVEANAYLDSVDEETLIVALDFHI